MLENNQNTADTVDFLNFVRPDTRYGKKWYEEGTARKGKLEPIPEVTPTKNMINPRDKMK